MKRTTIIIKSASGAEVGYYVTNDPRTGMGPDKYQAEVDRIVKMGRDAGKTVTVEETSDEDA